ncbi:hypothetical protein TTRE_0000334601 [Trichuris trichiura]|uniref:Uncharacterized protein n=1 Tax=Trichuris trichiura TaxID=36087 RepID=A0A077Z8R1_TRITR|nr:hypothetical protein TTRE_0000334601 [Trichuris trichiura]
MPYLNSITSRPIVVSWPTTNWPFCNGLQRPVWKAAKFNPEKRVKGIDIIAGAHSANHLVGQSPLTRYHLDRTDRSLVTNNCGSEMMAGRLHSSYEIKSSSALNEWETIGQKDDSGDESRNDRRSVTNQRARGILGKHPQLSVQ